MRNRWVRRSQRSGERKGRSWARPVPLFKVPHEESPRLSWEEGSKGWRERPGCCSGEFPPHGYCCPSQALLPSPTGFQRGCWSPQGTRRSPIIFNKAGENVFILFTFFCGGILLTESQLCSVWQCNKLFFSPAPLHEGMAMWHNLDQWNINRILLNISAFQILYIYMVVAFLLLPSCCLGLEMMEL